MTYLQALVLALIQGITEWLPISSSAHLILFPALAGWPDQGLAFDVAVHVGSLMAVLLYFRADIAAMARDWGRSLVTRRLAGEARLAWAVLFATIPVGLAGLAFKEQVEGVMRDPHVLAWALIGFGVLLWGADRWGRRVRTERQLTWKDVAVIGCAQALALIPGTSRSGITMTAGLAVGWTREAAARFSFLLAIPVIVLAGGLDAVDVVRGEAGQPLSLLAVGFLASALSAYLCIWAFLAWIRRIGMGPFVIYRIALGLLLLAVF
ncbi:UDP pyrophosphate phosphatase [Thiohalorhabdus denitrificans]|uniref:Undecaprenyl-diphosphatase n=1 Tax=Thiohalorhabdus denitrificans TaxID=381306 RepID=A0A0P9C7D5_9GAMM|nr:undecaprenyl-diphosphate phosphatase [Thiohalorhabdus denitrificans]KPV41040.1 UDP pyrophosphate phosphatase [Thiohalorhabdus denitrificans]SCY40714.1 undecaprenyl-diphosphatase [Thiohalorhabdus denitrificans]